MQNIAVFIDLNKTNFNFKIFKDIMTKLESRGQIVFAKLYNFSTTKHKEYLEMVSKLDIETTPISEENAKKRNKDFLDIREVVDVMEFVNGKTKIDTVFILTAKGNVVPLLKSLKMSNLNVIGAYDFSDKANMDMCNENFAYNFNASVKKIESKPVKKISSSVKKTVKAQKSVENVAKSNISKPKKSIPPQLRAYLEAKKQHKIIKPLKNESKTAKVDVENSTVSKEKSIKAKKSIPPQLLAYQQAKRDKKLSDKGNGLIKQESEVVNQPNTFQKESIIKTNNSGLVKTNSETEEEFFVRVLDNFAKRTGKLNFEFNEDIDEKNKLLNDIELFVEEQKKIQYEKDDFNPEIMAVLRELGNLASDIKATMDKDGESGDDEFDF